MKTFIIDTNALLSFVTDRNPEQQEVVSVLFEQAASLKCSILCHQHTITEFVYVLEKVYQTPKPAISRMVKDFLAMPGVELIHDIHFDVLLNFWPERVADFGDAVIATVWASAPKAAVVSFDKKFIKELGRLGATVHKTAS